MKARLFSPGRSLAYSDKQLNTFTARNRSLGQGYIFTPVCHSVHGGDVRGRGMYMAGGMHGRGTCMVGGVHGRGGGGMHDRGGGLRDRGGYGRSVNVRPVRILRECILVLRIVSLIERSKICLIPVPWYNLVLSAYLHS